MTSNLEWQKKAGCIDLPLTAFFEGYESNSEVAELTDEVCKLCPVQEQCLEFAVVNQSTGCHAGIYLNLGKYAKNRNKHKSKSDAIKLNNKVEALRKKHKPTK